ncbi:hypothetical protein NCF86_00125 [Pelagerythrobacter marinus]|nr:hypothetical protein NCF86_00125 [Pelagerythrobacter marinus]
MMKRATAAAYCDVSVAAFEGEVFRGRLPSPVILGGRDHWYKPALDRALEYIAGGLGQPDWEGEFWQEPVPDYRRRLRERCAEK